MDKALPALDHVFGQDDPVDRGRHTPLWTLGGGTAIALRIAHRLSDDVDIFVPSRPLKLFIPANNPAAKAISARYQWPGHYQNSNALPAKSTSSRRIYKPSLAIRSSAFEAARSHSKRSPRS
ncbi:MAG: nucleotidyl transferase AbiEii/AbiGii toxin family protein [Roseiarcus sp.]